MSEGLTSAEAVDLLKKAPALAGDSAMPAEGSLLPETYRYSYGDTRAVMIEGPGKEALELVEVR